MGNLDWENVKGNQKKPMPPASKVDQQAETKDDTKNATPSSKLESPYRKGEDSGMDPKENHKAHDAVAGEEPGGYQQNRDTGSQPEELA